MKNIVFIGDSLTGYFDWQKRFPDYDVKNLGIGGETVEGLMGRMDRIISVPTKTRIPVTITER